jgi:hypothetical protein
MAVNPNPTTYHWELGIDWEASINGMRYMPGGFVRPAGTILPTDPAVVKRAQVKSGDQIVFWFFDLTEGGPQVQEIETFTINSLSAVSGQPSIAPLKSLQIAAPRFTEDLHHGKFFETLCPVFRAGPIEVTNSGADETARRFLLTFVVQATGGSLGETRVFAHDPEMIVGPNTST